MADDFEVIDDGEPEPPEDLRPLELLLRKVAPDEKGQLIEYASPRTPRPAPIPIPRRSYRASRYLVFGIIAVGLLAIVIAYNSWRSSRLAALRARDLGDLNKLRLAMLKEGQPPTVGDEILFEMKFQALQKQREAEWFP